MVALRRPWATVVILALVASFFAPLLLFLRVPAPGISLLHARKEFDREGAGIVKILSPVHTSNSMQLNAMEQEVSDGVLEPKGVIYKDGTSTGFPTTQSDNITASNAANEASSVNGGSGKDQQNHVQSSAGGEDRKQGPSNKTVSGEIRHSSPSRSLTSEKIWEMEDQIIMARAYLQFSSPNSNSHLVRELKLRIKEIERVLGRANRDSDLSTSELQKMKAMEVTLSKARKAYPDCSAMASKLRAQLYNAEEQLRAQQNQASFLVHLNSRTFPKGLHCLSMRLTTEYFALQPEMRELANSQNVNKSDLYHYAIFSDNVVACAVTVNSTVSTSMEPEKIVFHVVTDSFNFPAMVMWFLLNPPGVAALQIQRLDDFGFLPAGFSSMFKESPKDDPRFISPLNHLRFYLPQVFPSLKKILLLDHDVVVQRDLSQLWSVDMKGKVNGAVEMCKGHESSHQLEMLVHFANPVIANTFNAKSCLWAFGMNIFDLQEWRRQGLTGTYHKWRRIGKNRQLWKAGSLPLGQLIFYNHTLTLDRRWHAFGLGSDSSLGRAEIERAAVIHFDGNMKPWLDTGIIKYRKYWTRFLDYSNPYFQQCNIHE
ncbi:putative galacturonosyltransferase 6 isoform X1 [Canna indica]|uniref:Hexosyltransferase n=1 Tax=Canna indica TaxID=4628 RepID=A0AAQ3JSU2_9LILI|nr:putative galacturonosyltransferase 6 isoform X1 [Canna indica]